MTFIEELMDRWSADARRLRQLGDDARATTLEVCCEELLKAVVDEGFKLLSPREASALTGYSTNRLSRFVSEGSLKNHGRVSRPLYRRDELPYKLRRKPKVALTAAASDRGDAVLRDMLASRTGRQ